MLWIESGLVSLGLLVLALTGASLRKGKEFHEDYLSLSATKPLRGLFAAIIVVHHLSGWFPALSLMTLLSHVGYLIVALFFFLSGYGLYYSYTKKPDYLHRFLQNRLPSVLLPYYICTFVWAIGLLLIKDIKTPIDILLSMFGIRIFVTGGWYACMLTILYILFFVSFRFGRQHKAMLFSALFLLTVVLLYISDVDSTWTRSLAAFPVGLLWCRYQDTVDRIIHKRYSLILCGSAVLFAVACGIRFVGVSMQQTILTGIGSHLSSALVPVFFFTLAQKLALHNRVLDFLGDISNEIYLLHYLVLILLGKLPLIASHAALFVVCTFICVIPTAWLVHKADTLLLRNLKKFLIK